MDDYYHCYYHERLLEVLEMIEDIEEMEEEEDEEELRSSNAKQTRRPRYKYRRVSWPEELERLLLPSGNQFQSRYHMSETSFNKLVGILGTKVQIDEKQSMRSTSGSLPFTPHHVVGAGLRFLGGELPKSIGDCYGCHPKTAHSMIARFLTAVDTTEDLDIKIPTSPAELKTPAELKKFLQKIKKNHGFVNEFGAKVATTTQIPLSLSTRIAIKGSSTLYNTDSDIIDERANEMVDFL